MAKERNILTQTHYIKAPLDLRKNRVLKRNNEKGETYSFEVTPGMFDFMEAEFQIPREKELKKAIIIDTGEIENNENK